MVATTSTKGSRCYRYYVCRAAQQQGWKRCPAPSVAAGTIERLVRAQLEGLDPRAFAEFALEPAPGEPTRLMRRLLERVDYDRVQGKLAITLQAEYASVLAERCAPNNKETGS
jgi:hypothetical protein